MWISGDSSFATKTDKLKNNSPGFHRVAAKRCLCWDNRTVLSAQVVRLPGLDHLFDGFPVLHFFVEDAAREVREFGVARKAQSDELTNRELQNARLQISGKKFFETQTHLEADD